MRICLLLTPTIRHHFLPDIRMDLCHNGIDVADSDRSLDGREGIRKRLVTRCQRKHYWL